jgi:hypothetical protein
MSKASRFLGFLLSRVRGVLGGISSIPLDLASFSGPNLGYGMSMRCSDYPQSLCKSVERIGRSGVGFRGVDPWELFIPSCQAHRYDRLLTLLSLTMKFVPSNGARNVWW